MQQVREQVGSAVQQATEIDESAARQDCPEDYKEGLLFKVKCGVSNVKSNAARVFRSDEAYDRYDFKDAREGIDKTEGGGVESYDQNKLQMPSEYPELERPPLRKVRRNINMHVCKKILLKDFTPTRIREGVLTPYSKRRKQIAANKLPSNKTPSVQKPLIERPSYQIAAPTKRRPQGKLFFSVHKSLNSKFITSASGF